MDFRLSPGKVSFCCSFQVQSSQPILLYFQQCLGAFVVALLFFLHSLAFFREENLWINKFVFTSVIMAISLFTGSSVKFGVPKPTLKFGYIPHIDKSDQKSVVE